MSAKMRHVRYLPNKPRSLGSPFGEADFLIGPGDNEVVMTMTPAAAEVLARVVAAQQLAGFPDLGTDDQPVWTSVVLDLLTAAAMCQPLPVPVLVATRHQLVERPPAVTSW